MGEVNFEDCEYAASFVLIPIFVFHSELPK